MRNQFALGLLSAVSATNIDQTFSPASVARQIRMNLAQTGQLELFQMIYSEVKDSCEHTLTVYHEDGTALAMDITKVDKSDCC